MPVCEPYMSVCTVRLQWIFQTGRLFNKYVFSTDSLSPNFSLSSMILQGFLLRRINKVSSLFGTGRVVVPATMATAARTKRALRREQKIERW